VLSDPKKRADYDHRGFAGVSGFSAEDLFGGIDFGDLFGSAGFGEDGGFGDLFGQLFRQRRAGPEKGRDVEIGLSVSMGRIAQGGEEQVRFMRHVACDACNGSGAEKGTQPVQCASCHGTGRVTRSRRERSGSIFIQQTGVCPVCHGRGVIIEKPCKVCGGDGRVARPESLAITIPPGIDDGMVLKVAGKGEASLESGGTPGDLFVMVRSAQDARFSRSGADLWREETLALTDAVLGTTLTVPTLDADATVTVPPGTQPDAVLRLRGKGLPRFRDQGRGDLYLRLRLHVPEHLTARERELYDRLRKMGD
jgi:molecular chaperone DnaJ